MTLTKGFNLLATAPDGIKRLRELILSLAVQGKLVPQDLNDEPASELLKQIRTEKDRLIGDSKIRKDKPLPVISDDEKPFELPENWAWARLPEVYASISPSGNKLMTSQMLEIGRFPVVDQGKSYIAGYTDNDAILIRIPEPIVIFGDHTTEVKYIDFDFVAGADGVKILWPLKQNAKFFYHQLRSFKLENRGYARHFRILNECIYALPPLAEQSRIVAKLEELMELCDALEAHSQLEAKQHTRLTATLFDALAASESAHQLQKHWARLAGSFDLVLDRPGAVDALEQTLLQLAVRGLLVPQDPNDEPASELLKQIRAEKDRLIAEGKIKKDKPLPAITEDEKPFELPQGWKWVRVGNVGVTQTGGTPASNRADFFDGNFPFIGPGQITQKGNMLPPEKFISELGRFESATAEIGDILMVCIGGSIGKCASATFETAFNQQINSIHPLISSSAYIFTAMSTLDFVTAVIKTATGSATPIISKGKWDLLLLPLPPLAEQFRIIARIEALRTLCDQLRERLAASRQTQAHLAEAMVAQV